MVMSATSSQDKILNQTFCTSSEHGHWFFLYFLFKDVCIVNSFEKQKISSSRAKSKQISLQFPYTSLRFLNCDTKLLCSLHPVGSASVLIL